MHKQKTRTIIILIVQYKHNKRTPRQGQEEAVRLKKETSQDVTNMSQNVVKSMPLRIKILHFYVIIVLPERYTNNVISH